MDGKYLKKYTFKTQFGILLNNAELEQITSYNGIHNGIYWGLCNNGTNKFSIHEITLRKSNFVPIK